jgi:hypothetical protein
MGIHRPLPVKPSVKVWVGTKAEYTKHLVDNGGRDPNTLYTIIDSDEQSKARAIFNHYKEEP